MAKAYADYTISDMKRLDLSFIVKDRPTEVQQVQREAFKYILTTAATARVKIDDWKVLEHFGTEDNTLITDRGQINRKIFERIEEIRLEGGHNSSGLEALKTDIMRYTQRDVDAQLREEEQHRIRHLRDAETSYRSYMEKLTRAHYSAKKIQELNILVAAGAGDDTIFKEIASILNNPFWQFLKHDFVGSNKKLYFATAQNVIVHYVKESANVDITHNFGQLVFELNLIVGRVKGLKGLNNTVRQSYWHPHISSSGSICWGNVSSRINNLLSESKYAKVFELLEVFITDYCPDNPYLALAEFVAQNEYKTSRSHGNIDIETYTIVDEIEDNSSIPWDIVTEVKIGDYVHLKGNFDTRYSEQYLNSLAIIEHFNGTYALNISSTDKRKITVRTQGSRQRTMTVSRDEICPISEEVRLDIVRRHYDRLCFAPGDKVLIRSLGLSGGYRDNIGKVATVANANGVLDLADGQLAGEQWSITVKCDVSGDNMNVRLLELSPVDMDDTWTKCYMDTYDVSPMQFETGMVRRTRPSRSWYCNSCAEEVDVYEDDDGTYCCNCDSYGDLEEL